MDVTRDSSQRPDHLPTSFPPALPERSGASSLAKTATVGAPAGPAVNVAKAAKPVGPADGGPVTAPLAVVPAPSQASPTDLREPM
ncbi:hypothetical protein J0670_31490, partial [Streptomyces sp. FH025]|nr:hypothetical protein [Streptomyces sp. FH025]